MSEISRYDDTSSREENKREQLDEWLKRKSFLIETYFPDGGNTIDNHALALSDREGKADRAMAEKILGFGEKIELTSDERIQLSVIAHGTLVMKIKDFSHFLMRILAASSRGAMK